jgi:hypothetical protein
LIALRRRSEEGIVTEEAVVAHNFLSFGL